MSEHIMENITIRPLNDVSEKLSKRANEHEIRNGTLSALKERCNRLESENAKLRYKVHVLENGNKWLQILNNSVEANNAKLRELVRDMMEFFEDGDWCVKCERALDCQEQEQYEDECLMRFVFRDRMRESGIEVTGK